MDISSDGQNGEDAKKVPPSFDTGDATPAKTGTALMPFAEQAHRETEAGAAAPPRHERWIVYGGRAALVAGLLSIGLVTSRYFVEKPAPAKQAVVVKPAISPEAAERAELQKTAQAMAGEIHALKASLDAVRNTLAHSASVEELRALQKNLDGLRAGIESSKGETTASLAQIGGKIDHLQHDAKLREVSERLDRIEKQMAGPATTASIPAATVNPAPVPMPPSKGASENRANESKSGDGRTVAEAADPKKPPLVKNWVVRDVYNGVALVEGRYGAMEVVPGETIPGVGRVKSIERRGPGWIVVTDRGLVDFARD